MGVGTARYLHVKFAAPRDAWCATLHRTTLATLATPAVEPLAVPLQGVGVWTLTL